MKKLNKKGFTLIEMLVVIAIIAILVAIIIPTVTNATEKAKQARDVANIRSLVAQYEITTVTGTDTEKTAAIDALKNFTKSAKKGEYTYTAAKVTYTATLLTDGNVSESVYAWDIGDLYSDAD